MQIFIAIALFMAWAAIIIFDFKPGAAIVRTLYRFARWTMAVAAGSDHWLTEYRRVKALRPESFTAQVTGGGA